jgi:hypothetical protein
MCPSATRGSASWVKNNSDTPIQFPNGAHHCIDQRITVVDNVPLELPGRATMRFSVRFNPQEVRPHACPISFTDNRTPSVSFTGRGIPTTNTLSVSVNDSSFSPGETMALTATMTPLDTPSTADAYVVVQLPSGHFLSMQLNGALVPGIVPIASNIVPVPFTGTLVQYLFTGIEPPGEYTWYSVLTQPGTLVPVGILQQTPFRVP